MQMAGTSVMTSPSSTRTGTCFLGLMRSKSLMKPALETPLIDVNWRPDSWRRICGHVEHAIGAQ